MSLDKNVPEIRFKGFSGEWVDCDLKSFSDSFSYGLNASAVKFDGVNKYLRITDIDEKSRNFDYCHLTSPDADLSKSDDYLLKNGDILFARTGASVGKTYIYNEQDGKVYFAGFLIRASINHKASAQFIFQNTQTHEYARFVATTSQRSGQPGINAKEYGEYRLFSPNEPEQTLIGNYFQKIDSLINQHQQKHDKLSNIKKAMLENMFPKQGNTIPKIRFKGFGREWAENTLSEIANVIDPHPSHRAPDAVDNGVPFIGIGDISDVGLVYWKNVRIVPSHIYNEHSARYTIEKGDFAYGRVASVGKIIDLSNNVGCEYTYSPTMAIVKPTSLYPAYLRYYLQTEVFKDHVANKTSGSTRKSLGVQDFRCLPVLFPLKDEQTQIGNYFQKLDALINQHQQQITKLNNIKQACLSKMFV